MKTVVYHVEQGSEEWFRLRAGAITASEFATARATLKSGKDKGSPTAAARNLAFRLAIERISGEPLDEGFEPWQAKRGRELEADARTQHALTINRPIEAIGFVGTEDGKFGASADGLIGEDGGAEYKAFLSPEKLRSIIIENDWSDIREQAQGCMWLTGRKWWHVVLYCPALEPAGRDLIIHEEHRDDEFIAEMERDLWAFDRLVESYRQQIQSGANDPEEHQPEPLSEAGGWL